MKRLFLLMVLMMAGAVAQAAPKEITLEQFIASKKAAAEKSEIEFNEAAAKKQFDKKDLNKDGKLSVEEQAPAPKKEKAE